MKKFKFIHYTELNHKLLISMEHFYSKKLVKAGKLVLGQDNGIGCCEP